MYIYWYYLLITGTTSNPPVSVQFNAAYLEVIPRPVPITANGNPAYGRVAINTTSNPSASIQPNPTYLEVIPGPVPITANSNPRQVVITPPMHTSDDQYWWKYAGSGLHMKIYWTTEHINSSTSLMYTLDSKSDL